jgi:peptidoglycan hydrolase CwlO-like protein
MRELFTRRIVAVAVAALLALTGAAWSGCGGNDAEDEAQEQVDEVQEQVEKQSEELNEEAQEQIDKAQKKIDEAQEEAP